MVSLPLWESSGCWHLGGAAKGIAIVEAVKERIGYLAKAKF